MPELSLCPYFISVFRIVFNLLKELSLNFEVYSLYTRLLFWKSPRFFFHLLFQIYRHRGAACTPLPNSSHSFYQTILFLCNHVISYISL